MSDAIVYADDEGVIRLWNRDATRIFGVTEAEALGCSLNEVALDARPAAVMLSFGDPTPFTGRIKAARCKITCQVQTLAAEAARIKRRVHKGRTRN